MNDGQDSARIALAVCGDPVVSRALVLLLQGNCYDARFLSASSLGEPGSLRKVRLLLLIPTPEVSSGRREAFVAACRKEAKAAKIPILELVATEEGRDVGEDDESEHVAFWPCTTEDLELRIEAVLSSTSGEG